MATEALKSDVITNVVASTQTLNNPYKDGKGKVAKGFVTALAASDVGSTYRMVRLPSNAIINRVTFRTDGGSAGGATGVVDIGTHTASNTTTIGAVLDANLWGNYNIATPSTGTDVTVAGAVTLATCNQPLWQQSGLSTDPGGYIEVVLTSTTDIAVQDTIFQVEVEYCAG